MESANIQNEILKCFDINSSVNFWNPTSLYLKVSNSVILYRYPDETNLSTGTLSNKIIFYDDIINAKRT
jgi:hypothetical protein